MNPASHPGSHSQPADPVSPAVGNTSDTAVDPVCGMTVPVASPHRLTHAGREYVFCCEGCRDLFKADPERYLHASAAPATHTQHGGAHARHGAAHARHGAAHAHRGAAPSQQPSTSATAATQWTCPMHP